MQFFYSMKLGEDEDIHQTFLFWKKEQPSFNQKSKICKQLLIKNQQPHQSPLQIILIQDIGRLNEIQRNLSCEIHRHQTRWKKYF